MDATKGSTKEDVPFFTKEEDLLSSDDPMKRARQDLCRLLELEDDELFSSKYAELWAGAFEIVNDTPAGREIRAKAEEILKQKRKSHSKENGAK